MKPKYDKTKNPWKLISTRKSCPKDNHIPIEVLDKETNKGMIIKCGACGKVLDRIDMVSLPKKKKDRDKRNKEINKLLGKP